MRRRRYISGLGADSSMYAMFESQLNSYKSLLISLYRKKTKAIAERESLRFQYLTGMKAKLSNVFSAIYSQLFSDLNPDGEEMTRYVLSFIQNNIPMISLNGGSLQGWSGNPYMVGGRLGLGYLSPITHFLSEPFHDPGNEDRSPGYKIYGSSFLSPGQNTAWVISQYFLGNTGLYGVNELEGQVFEFTVPPSEGWVRTYFQTRHNVPNLEQTMTGYPYMVAMLSATYPAGNLIAIIDEARDMVATLVEKTKSIIQLQLDIDRSEEDLANFVSEYKDYMGQSYEDILMQIKTEADKSESLPLPPSSSDYSVNSTSVAVPGVDALPPAPVAPPPKSKLPWIAAAVAIAYMVKGK